jgi:hypothetical protein
MDRWRALVNAVKRKHITENNILTVMRAEIIIPAGIIADFMNVMSCR